MDGWHRAVEQSTTGVVSLFQCFTSRSEKWPDHTCPARRAPACQPRGVQACNPATNHVVSPDLVSSRLVLVSAADSSHVASKTPRELYGIHSPATDRMIDQMLCSAAAKCRSLRSPCIGSLQSVIYWPDNFFSHLPCCCRDFFFRFPHVVCVCVTARCDEAAMAFDPRTNEKSQNYCDTDRSRDAAIPTSVSWDMMETLDWILVPTYTWDPIRCRFKRGDGD